MRRADVPLPSVAQLDASSRPSGTGLPPGRGSLRDGAPSGTGLPPARRAREGAPLREICSIFIKNQTNFGSEIGL